MNGPVVIGNATLYQGDCRDILPAIAAEALITDPPWPNVRPGLLPGSDDPYGLFASAMARIQAKRLVIILRADSDPLFLNPIPRERWPYFRQISLPYVLPSYIGRKLGGDEIAYCFGPPVPSSGPGRHLIPGRGPLAQPADRPDIGHPCSRALIHMQFLVGWCSDPGETVLDPFMGSGTLGMAAVAQGRRFVGIEIEPRWFDLACRRIEEAQRQGMIAL